ncbi:MAG: SdpI family protein [Acidobacteria bacterium]|nr:SdpI family protein [Acidobacteriota bacterium]
MTTRSYLLCGALTLAALVAAAVAYPYLPPEIPTHWNLRGEVDGHAPASMIFLVGPGLMALQMLVFAVLPWLSPKRFEVEAFRGTYLYLMVVLVALSGYLFGVILASALVPGFPAGRAVFGGVAVLFALAGNVMGRVRRNFFIGVRTPWTLASDRVWYATHRVAGKSMVGTALVALFVLISGGPVWAACAALAAGLLVPVVHSLWLYKRLERGGAMD